MKRYDPKVIEPKWQKIWDETGIYTADLQSDKPTYIAMSMFNYPSGAGIHIGHAMNYTISDVMARYKRQQGYESYHPVGWDAFGLPAENYAIKAGVSPQDSMARIIPSYHTQYKAMGWSNDWSKEISTHLPEYYHWTQWIFAEMYRQGLAYQDARMQWWCTKCQTVLANEQVIDGKCWRHDGADDPEVTKKEVKQWFFRITDYADELLEATDALDWSDVVKTAQKNWIGRSVGSEIEFEVSNLVDRGAKERKSEGESQHDDDEKQPNFVILHGYTGRADKNFIPTLKTALEHQGYNVQTPQMPHTDTPDENEQVGYVLETCTFDENTILVGHSLGGAVAMKIVQKLPHTLRGLVLVAPVIEPQFRPKDYQRPFLNTFDLTYDYDKIRQQAKTRIVMSDTQEVERHAYLEYLAPKIDANLSVSTAHRRHFTADDEPEILNTLLSSFGILPKSKIQNPKSTPITVFTTRPDTLFGATFLVLAPEHEMVEQLTTPEQSAAVKDYIAQSLKKSEVERQSEGKEKTGVFTGSYATSPINGTKIPIWVADYVLGGYGTGAIMAVPAHDERDHEFAVKFELPIIDVVIEDFGTSHVDEVDVRGVVVLGYDKSTKKFLGLRSTMPDHHAWLAGGGINEGETFDECAKRELREETGYDAEELIQLGQPVFSHYFNEKKNSYRRSFAPHYLAYVSGEPNTAAREDHETFDIEWFTYDELYRDIEKTGGGVEHWLEVLERARKVIAGEELEVFHGDGVLINSGAFDGVASAEARDLIVQHLEREGKGRAKTTYKLRDWSVSRQRYWGAPIPIINCPRDGAVLVPDDQLPVVLPELTDFAPSGDGRSALARATEWLTTTCPTCGGPAERETDTLDTYICSSWYELRYFDPANTKKPFEPATANKWMPIDFYNGGDHATAHLLYVRFVARFFHTLGLLDNPEPFKKFLFNGKVKASDGSAFSKSKGNGVDPLEIINQGYGADALRTYLMFAAPLDLDSRWDPQGVPGTHRFLSRIWNLAQEFLASDPQSTRQLADQNPKSTDVLRIIHRTIKKVTEDLESQKYNTAIAAMMKCVNELYEAKTRDGFADRESWQCALESLAALVAPFAPHTADELWHQLGHGTSVQRDSWPVWDDRYLVDDTLKLAVQVNGKVRAEITIAADTPKADIEAAALSHERIVELLGDKKPARVIYVPGRLVNIVV